MSAPRYREVGSKKTIIEIKLTLPDENQ